MNKPRMLLALCAISFLGILPAGAQVIEDGTLAASASSCTSAGDARVTLELPPDAGSAIVGLSGTWAGTVEWFGTVDGSTYVALNGDPLPSGAAASTATANGTWVFNVSALKELCVRASTYTSGTIQVRIKSSTAFARNRSASSLNVASLNNVRYCNQFAGADAGAKITACIADLPSTGGTADARGLEGTQTITSTLSLGKPTVLLLGCATYTASASINVTSPVKIIGSGDCTKLVYSGSGTFITFNFGGSTNDHFWKTGLENLTVEKSGAAGSSIGLFLGGTSGAEGFIGYDVKVGGAGVFFGTGVKYGDNTWGTAFYHSSFIANTTNIDIPAGLANSGEMLNATDSFSQGPGGGSSGADCIKVGIGALSWKGGSIDDCQVVVSSGTAFFNHVHFENPGGNSATNFIDNTSGVVVLSGVELVNTDTTPSFTSLVDNHSGTMLAIGTNANSAATVTNLFAVSGGTLQLYGTRFFSGYTNEYAISGTGEVYGYDKDALVRAKTQVQVNHSSGLAANTTGKLIVCGADVTPTIRCPELRNNGNGQVFGLTDASGNYWSSFDLNAGAVSIASQANANVSINAGSGRIMFLSVPRIPYYATAPGSPATGDQYMDTTPAPDELCVYDGTGWQALITGTDANCQ